VRGVGNIKEGDRFGRLLAVSFLESRGWTRLWVCRCDCGAEKIVRAGNLRSGHTTSCGCFRRENSAQLGRNVSASNVTHGMSKTRMYGIWEGMMSRCYSEKNRAYHNYGGRGIGVCERWHKFEGFLNDMGERPDGLTLDRIDNNGNYSKSNCRWATRTEQQNNLRKNRFVSANGERMTIAQWARRTGLKPATIHTRLRYGWTEQDTATRPLNWRRK
jgi:hypothetical protein